MRVLFAILNLTAAVSVAFLFAAGCGLISDDVFAVVNPPIVIGWQVIPGYVEVTDEWIVVGIVIKSLCSLVGYPWPQAKRSKQ